jgi:hypothetical protein
MARKKSEPKKSAAERTIVMPTVSRFDPVKAARKPIRWVGGSASYWWSKRPPLSIECVAGEYVLRRGDRSGKELSRHPSVIDAANAAEETCR